MLVRKVAENYKLPYFTLSPTYSICRSHGYLVGEQPECPICHKKTEIWSRITGYYRPISNWNDGKVKEFEMRKEYEPEHSHLTHEGVKAETTREDLDVESGAINTTPAAAPSKKGLEDGIYFFGTKTCPKCVTAKELFQEAGIFYKYMDAEENEELTYSLNIYQAPTVVIVRNGDTRIASGLSSVKKLVKELED